MVSLVLNLGLHFVGRKRDRMATVLSVSEYPQDELRIGGNVGEDVAVLSVCFTSVNSLLEEDVHLPIWEMLVEILERSVCDWFAENEEADCRPKRPTEHPAGNKGCDRCE